MKRLEEKRRKHAKRKMHIKKKLTGTTERPRLTVFKSNKNLYVQVIDDCFGNTLASVSTLEKDLRDIKLNAEGGRKIGEYIGQRLKEKKINEIVFDRNGYLYHGIVQALAEGARSKGVKF